MLGRETFEKIRTWDELILFCISSKCPVGNELYEGNAEKNNHRVFDVHGDMFAKRFTELFRQCGFVNFQKKASSLFQIDATGCHYAVMDDEGNLYPATDEDFPYIKQEVADWCENNYWVNEVVA